MVLDGGAEIYRLVADVDRYVTVTGAENDIAQLVELGAFRGQPLADRWRPVHVWILEEYPDQVRHDEADLLRFIGGCLVITERAREVLSPVLERVGELLPLEASSPMYVFNCTNVIDALDADHTKGEKFPSGVGYIHVASYGMRKSAVSGQAVFKVPEPGSTDEFL